MNINGLVERLAPKIVRWYLPREIQFLPEEILISPLRNTNVLVRLLSQQVFYETFNFDRK